MARRIGRRPGGGEPRALLEIKIAVETGIAESDQVRDVSAAADPQSCGDRGTLLHPFEAAEPGSELARLAAAAVTHRALAHPVVARYFRHYLRHLRAGGVPLRSRMRVWPGPRLDPLPQSLDPTFRAEVELRDQVLERRGAGFLGPDLRSSSNCVRRRVSYSVD
jgi:hypothetical protein